MKIADVYNEKSKEYYRQENASEYAYITADEYTSAEVIDMEKKILTLLDFNLFSPGVSHFSELYMRVLSYRTAEGRDQILLFSQFLNDYCLLSYEAL